MEKNTEQRKNYTLNEEQLEAIAERGAQLAFEKMTTRVFIFVGRGIIERLFWILGILTVGLYFWLESKGFLK